jgi:hypothetical protein
LSGAKTRSPVLFKEGRQAESPRRGCAFTHLAWEIPTNDQPIVSGAFPASCVSWAHLPRPSRQDRPSFYATCRPHSSGRRAERPESVVDHLWRSLAKLSVAPGTASTRCFGWRRRVARNAARVVAPVASVQPAICLRSRPPRYSSPRSISANSDLHAAAKSASSSQAAKHPGMDRETSPLYEWHLWVPRLMAGC